MPVLNGTDKIGDWNVTKLTRFMSDWFKQHPLPTSAETKALVSAAVTPISTTSLFFNVKDFGAKGDGRSFESAAVQHTIDACASAGGGVVFFPAGTYLLETMLTVSAGPITLVGQSATLKLANSFTRSSQGQGHILVTGSDVTLDGLRFDGNKAFLTPDTTNNFAVWGTNAARATVRNCYVTSVNGGGANANSAFVFAGSCDYSRFVNNTIVSCGGGAIFTQGHHCIASGNVLSGLSDVGIVFNSTGARFCTAVGNVVENIPAQCAFGVENGCSDWTISGNTVSGCFGGLDLNDASYAGPQLNGGVFANNEVIDLDKGASSQTATIGVYVRSQYQRNVKIVNNTFSGLVPYSTVDSFVYVSLNTEGLEIRGNTFESKAQALPAAILVHSSSTQTRLTIDGNTIRSTSSTTKLARGVWLQASSSYTNASIARNQFENITNYAVHFDTGVSWSGELRDNFALSNASVGALYRTSPWGTFAPGSVVNPHVLRNSAGRSVWYEGSIPTSGTWLVGDLVFNLGPSGAVAGWICTASGTPVTWRALSPKGGTSTQTPGAVTTVNIAHGLGVAPSTYAVQPANTNARGAPAFFLSADATNITLNFASALTASTSYSWIWQAG